MELESAVDFEIQFESRECGSVSGFEHDPGITSIGNSGRSGRLD